MSSWRSMLVAIGLAGGAAAAPAAETDLSSALRSHDVFLKARTSENWSKVQSMLHTIDFPKDTAREMIEWYLDGARKKSESGVHLLRERVERTEIYREGSRAAAFFRVQSFFSHPLSQGNPVPQRRTLIAVTENGKEWRFVGISCFSQVHMKHLFPGYTGSPSLTDDLYDGRPTVAQAP